MEIQVKERLTGAVILVALLVLLVPELLTGPRRAPSAVTAAKPAAAAPMRSYTVDLADTPSPQQRATPVPAEPKEPEAAHPAQARPVAAPSAAPQPAEQATPVQRPAPALPPPAAPRAAAEPPVTGWSVQLGSFQSRENAQRLVKELRVKGFTAFVLDGGGRSGKLYRVRVGPAADRPAAAALAAKLRQAGKPGAIVPYP